MIVVYGLKGIEDAIKLLVLIGKIISTITYITFSFQSRHSVFMVMLVIKLFSTPLKFSMEQLICY